jgi:tetratricopeptide (TPR) repeat protein
MWRVPSPGAECHATADDQACAHAPEVRACLAAEDRMLPATTELCDRAWQLTGDEAAAVAGAYFALRRGDDAALGRWAERALPTVQGAHIFEYVGEMQQHHDDFEGAVRSFRRAFDLQLDRDPARAANTALWLLAMVRSSDPAEESIRLARVAWEQAERSGSELIRPCAAMSLVEILIDIGELTTAQAVIELMDATRLAGWQAVRDVAMARLEAARGQIATSIVRFRRAIRRLLDDPGTRNGLPHDVFELVQVLLDDGQVAEARRELDRARGLVERKVVSSQDVQAQLAVAEASVELAENDIDAALASAVRGLALNPRGAARVRLLNVRGGALARRGDAVKAEQAWREAADSVEAWRASLPTTQLRGGLVARHRRVLEAWLDSTGQRGDADGALEVTRRIVGRELLDRIYQREANAPATADASIRNLEQRLADRRELAVTMADTAGRSDLRDATHDMVAIMLGARSVWAIRRMHGRWSITSVGDRWTIHEWVDAYRDHLDDPVIASRLGQALFPQPTLPATGAPLVVMLDPELSDVALPGLRVGGKYLVEHAAIFEVLAPDLLFTPAPAGPWDAAVAIGDPRGDLPDAEVEVRAVAEDTGAAVYLGRDATRAVVEDARRARVLHVATHSSFEDGRATFALFDDALSANDIVNRKIAPRLAVIATCRSQVDGGPTRSLVAAFLAAGSPAVIGVKRALDDKDSAALMRRFYALHGATSPLGALALAQRAAIAAGLPPRAWATVSFFGVGGWLDQ